MILFLSCFNFLPEIREDGSDYITERRKMQEGRAKLWYVRICYKKTVFFEFLIKIAKEINFYEKIASIQVKGGLLDSPLLT